MPPAPPAGARVDQSERRRRRRLPRQLFPHRWQLIVVLEQRLQQRVHRGRRLAPLGADPQAVARRLPLAQRVDRVGPQPVHAALAHVPRHRQAGGVEAQPRRAHVERDAR
eukprot:CAMPEP_0182799588 /NCGR_PEP_ID=MMETSP0006_2-20121128/1964_1 /TAXON_ID=97485 /ORGANISM="Prymnesium parvum, Strain Texoma1" /LENGTH=109 /DNA_ID=CAMNT_0024924783 /DNA_START=744 /DNA_END=1069 /DNA_ORIENTATION=-